MTKNESQPPIEPPSFDPIARGEIALIWIDNGWQQHMWYLEDKRYISIERSHHIFGHQSINLFL